MCFGRHQTYSETFRSRCICHASLVFIMHNVPCSHTGNSTVKKSHQKYEEEFSQIPKAKAVRFYLGQASELVCHYLHYCIQEWPFLTWGLLHCVQIQSSGENCTCSPEDASHYKMKDQQQTIVEWKPPCRSLYQTCVSEQHCINLFNRIKYGCFQNLQPLKLYPLLWNVNTTEWSCNDEITSFAFPTARAWSWYSFNWAQCQSWSIIRKALD